MRKLERDVRRGHPVIVDCALYRAGTRVGEKLSVNQAATAAKEQDGFIWLGIHEPSEQEFSEIAEHFGLHELAVQDAVRAHQRPKIEIYNDTFFFVIKTVNFAREEKRLETGELMLFVHKHFVIAVRHGKGSLRDARRYIEQQRSLLEQGPFAVLYIILDSVVDDYQTSVEKLDLEIQAVEESVFTPERTNPAKNIYNLERETLAFHRSLAPFITVFDDVLHRDQTMAPESLTPYFRDVHDHLLRVESRLTGLRELLASVLQANLAQVSVQQNEDMRKISAWAAILAVPTMLAGIYGMNFTHMPELHWKFGYPMILFLAALICFILFSYFRRSKWL